MQLLYQLLSWKVQHALIKAKLEPYLGFLYSTAKGKPSLVCDFQELYRYLVDDFAIDYCKSVKASDFVPKTEAYSSNKMGKRQYLNEIRNKDFVNHLNRYFETRGAIPRIRRGEHQEIETLIKEEAFLFAKYLRDKKPTWSPRIVELS
jgi:CRISPR/Cas system-associated endonuclease Cas1